MDVIALPNQLAWFYMTGRWGRATIDHRDGNPANNRWKNLRVATPSQNNANRRRPRNNTSGFKGVCLTRNAGNGRQPFARKGSRFASAGSHAESRPCKLFGEFARTD